MTDLTHAVGFLQNAYTILLALALSEGFKQFVVDTGNKEIQWDRLPFLLAFLFLIFPFFHGMSRYLFTVYLDKNPPFHAVVGYLMFDGICFMCISAVFFVLSRSLSSKHWRRFYTALLLLLAVDSIWILVSICRGLPFKPWLILNAILATVLLALLIFKRSRESKTPSVVCASSTFLTCIVAYYWMSGFYFPQ